MKEFSLTFLKTQGENKKTKLFSNQRLALGLFYITSGILSFTIGGDFKFLWPSFKNFILFG